jgi:ribosomal protein L18
MSLISNILDSLSENPRVNIRRTNREIIIHLKKDVITIDVQARTAGFLDVDSTDDKTLRETYYSEFPEVEDLYKALVKKEYSIEP